MRRKKFWVICFPGPQYRPFLFFPQPGHLSPSCAAGDNGPRGSSGQPHAAGELSKMRSLHSQCHACGLRSGQLVTVTSREHGSWLLDPSGSCRLFSLLATISSAITLSLILMLASSAFHPFLMLQSFADLSAWTAAPLFSPPASLQQQTWQKRYSLLSQRLVAF